MKKGLLFALLLICSNMIFAYDFEANGIYYNVTSTTELTAEVTSGDNNYSGVVSIPSSVVYKSRTLNVTAIGDGAFSNDKELFEVKIPNSVTSIGRGAFAGCTSFTSLSIPNSVNNIGGRAFAGCTSLVDFRIEDSENVLSFEKGIYLPYIFDDCPLTTLYVGRNLSYTPNYTYGYSPFYENKTIKSVIFGEYVTVIPESLFEYCDAIKHVSISNSVRDIKRNAFYNCSEVSVHISNIANWCLINFYDMHSNPLNTGGNLYLNGELLKELIIPEGITEVKSYAFYKYCNLISVKVPNSLNFVRNNAFYGCEGLGAVYIESLSSWCNIEFESMIDNLLCYAKSMYLNNKLLKELQIPNDITEIKKYSFACCESIEKVYMSNNIEYIGESAFNDCVKITDVVLSSNLKNIDSRAFSGCGNIIELTIPQSVTKIKEDAFDGLSSLKMLYFEDGEESLFLPSIYSYKNGLFKDCPLENLYLGRELIFSATPNNYDSPFYGIGTLTSVTIGSNTSFIGKCMFQGCYGISYIYLLGSTPPVVNDNNFTDNQFANTIVYVPTGTLTTYLQADVWKNFWNIQEFDETCIENIVADNVIEFIMYDDGIIFTNIIGKQLTIYSANGSLIKDVIKYNGEKILLESGNYIVYSFNKSVKIIL